MNTLKDRYDLQLEYNHPLMRINEQIGFFKYIFDSIRNTDNTKTKIEILKLYLPKEISYDFFYNFYGNVLGETKKMSVKKPIKNLFFKSEYQISNSLYLYVNFDLFDFDGEKEVLILENFKSYERNLMSILNTEREKIKKHYIFSGYIEK